MTLPKSTHPVAFLAAAALFAVVVAALTIRAVTYLHQPGVVFPEVDPAAWTLRDFRDGVYYPLQAVLDGVNPYSVEPYVSQYPVGQDFPPYSPITFVLHLPLALLPLEIAQWVYFGVTVLLTLLLAKIALAMCRLPGSAAAVLGLAALMLASRPGHMNLLLGQTTVPLAIFCLLGLRFARSRPWLSGACLALATFKPTYGVPMLILVWAMGYVRASLAGIVLTVAFTAPLIVSLVVMQGGWSELGNQISQREESIYDHPGRDPSRSFSRIDAISLGARMVHEAPSMSTELGVTASMLLLAVAVLAATRRLRATDGGLDPPSALATLGMLIAIYHHAYDALLLAAILLYAWLSREPFWQVWPAVCRVLWCALLAIPLVNYAATNSVIVKWNISGAAWTVLTSVNGAALLLASVVMAFVMLRLSRVASLSPQANDGIDLQGNRP